MNKRVLSIIISIMLILNILFSFSACGSGSGSNATAVSIGNAEVGKDIYMYFLDEVLRDENAELPEEDAFADAKEKAAYYVKINTEFKKRSLSLSSADKAEIASEVNSMWNIYGNYYTKLGVTKETLTKVKESEAFEQALINAIYGTGGDSAVSEESRKDFYSKNYVFFKAISAYIASMSAEEADSLKTRFSDMKSSITAENTIDAVNLAYVEANGGSAEAEMPILSTSSSSDAYPKNFFSDVASMENSSVSVLTYDDYIFIVQKLDGSGSYSDYADDVLKAMVIDDFISYIEDAYSDIKVSEDEGVEKSCYSAITNNR